MLRRTDFEKIQKKTGFNLDLLEKAYNLTHVLHEIQKKDILKANLSLKGGTALNFIYLDIPRLSINIDFNYTGKIAREDMKENRPLIEKSITALGEELGYEVKPRGQSYIMSRHNLKYTTIRNTNDHIKIEINYLDCLPIDEFVIKKFPSIFPDISSFPVKTYTLEEILAQKIKACIERTMPRDIYDLFCLSNQKLNMDKTKHITTIYYCMCNNNDTKDPIKKIENYDLEKLEQELQQFVRVGVGFEAKKIREKSAGFLEQVLSFSVGEQKFIDSFFENGMISPEILFKNKSIIKKHPVLLNKLKIIKKSE